MSNQLSQFSPSKHARPLRSVASLFLKSPPKQLHCRQETSFDKLETYRDTWDDATSRLGGSIYFSYDWARLWWGFYGDGAALRIFIFSSADEIVAILPIYVEVIRFGPVSLKLARLVGSNIPPKAFNPPVDPAFADDVFQHVLLQLFREEGCDALSFGPVSEFSSSAEALSGAARQASGLVARTSETSNGVHSVWHLPQTMDDYFQSLSRNERKNRKADLKKLQNEHAGRIEVVRDPVRVDAEFENFLQQHAVQWAAEGRTGHFGAWPCAAEFNRALVKAHGRLGRVRFIRILAGEKTITNLYAFAFGDCYYCELPARSIDPKWDRFSLGPAGIVATIGAAISEGQTRLEGGLAHYDYKLRLGAKEYSVKTLRVVANRPAARLRMLIFTALRLGLLYGYHKIWYRRIAPHLRAFAHRPQWSLWLRLEF
jgi:CelD/BcsL family acetyltransferase involved in cellulose biosynthesis